MNSPALARTLRLGTPSPIPCFYRDYDRLFDSVADDTNLAHVSAPSGSFICAWPEVKKGNR
jgi:hypothetical protein